MQLAPLVTMTRTMTKMTRRMTKEMTQVGAR
jgi:hypothetical protein